MYATVGWMIEIDRRGDTLVLTPQRNLRELEAPEIEVEQEALRHLWADEQTLRNVVVDFGRTDYFGSTAIGLLTQLWHGVRERGGVMSLCRLSMHEEDILDATGLREAWPVYPTLEAAFAVIDRTASAVR
jgi:anti-anti-sigma factor